MQVSLYATLRALVGSKTVEVELPPEATVRELAGELARRWPALREHLLDEEGALSRRVHVYLDGRSVRWLPDGDATSLEGARSIALFPPVAGG